MRSLISVKAFRIQAKYRRAKKEINVRRDVLAINKNAALEKFLSELGRHGVKRNEIDILNIEEIDPSEVRSSKLRKIALAEKPVIYTED